MNHTHRKSIFSTYILLGIITIASFTGLLTFSNAAQADQGLIRIENRWYPDQRINIENGPVVSTNAPDGWWSAMWTIEVEQGDFVRIKNRWKGTYLHNEHGQLESGPIENGWWSAMWVLEPIGGDYVRIKNRWKNTYLHNQNGKLEIGNIQTNWWSAMWKVNPVK